MNIIPKIVGRKFSLDKSYFKNNSKKGHPDSILDIALYWKKYGELPFEYSGNNWLYDTMSARQKEHRIHNDQYLTSDIVSKQLVELTNNFSPKENKVLNACCGIGQLTKYLLDNKFDVYGYDNDSDLIEVCKIVYPKAHFYQYDFCVDNHVLSDLTMMQQWELIVANPPMSKVNIVSFLGWLSQALSVQGKAVVLMNNDFEYKNYSKVYKSHIERFKILRKEKIEKVDSDLRIYLLELSENYKIEKGLEEQQIQFIEKDEEKNTINKQCRSWEGMN